MTTPVATPVAETTSQQPMPPLTAELLRSFELTRTLSSDTLAKSTILLGTLLGQPAILTLARAALPAGLEGIGKLVEGLVDWQARGENGIYYWGGATPGGEAAAGGLEINLVWPATELHVRKHEMQEYRLVTETAELYATVTVPYVRSLPPSRTTWVQNILDGLKEQEAILLRTPNFVLLPDSKWDLTTVANLYLTAIAVDGASLRSLRDLRGKHLDLLRNIKAEVHRFVGERWGLKSSQIRCFIHYQPSYYHLHIHVTHISYVSPSSGTACERAHLLDQVIALLELDPEIYAKLPLTYALGDRHGLYPLMQAAGAL